MATVTMDANYLDTEVGVTVADGGTLGAKSVRVIYDDTLSRDQVLNILDVIRRRVLMGQYPNDLGLPPLG
ncbi:MAG TPA: hypothetical protein VFS41_05095 [Edaphobacter sp.]|nr:hypothetical protein [Edaphobacter sp.]